MGIANSEINIEIKPGIERIAELNNNFLSKMSRIITKKILQLKRLN